MSYAIMLAAKGAQLVIAGPGGVARVTREDVIRAASGPDGCSPFQFSLILARYCNLESANFPKIIDPVYQRLLVKAEDHPKIEPDQEGKTALARVAWLAVQRYLIGDKCPKCNGSGNLKSRRNKQGEVQAARLCDRCGGTGVSAYSDRLQARQTGIDRNSWVRHGWKELCDEAVSYLRVEDQLGLKIIYYRVAEAVTNGNEQ